MLLAGWAVRGKSRSLPANQDSQLAFSADGTPVMGTHLKTIVGRSPAGKVSWSLETPGYVHAVAPSDGTLAVAESMTNKVRLWDLRRFLG